MSARMFKSPYFDHPTWSCSTQPSYQRAQLLPGFDVSPSTEQKPRIGLRSFYPVKRSTVSILGSGISTVGCRIVPTKRDEGQCLTGFMRRQFRDNLIGDFASIRITKQEVAQEVRGTN